MTLKTKYRLYKAAALDKNFRYALIEKRREQIEEQLDIDNMIIFTDEFILFFSGSLSLMFLIKCGAVLPPIGEGIATCVTAGCAIGEGIVKYKWSKEWKEILEYEVEQNYGISFDKFKKLHLSKLELELLSYYADKPQHEPSHMRMPYYNYNCRSRVEELGLDEHPERIHLIAKDYKEKQKVKKKKPEIYYY